MFKSVSGLLLFIFSSLVIAEIEIPQSVQDQIVADVIVEVGYYDVAEINSRLLLWQSEQPPENSSGELTDSGSCGDSCTQTGGNNDLPKPRNVKLKGKKVNDDLTQNFVVKWKRPAALPDGSLYKLKNYRVIVSKDGATYKKYKVKANFKNNGKPKKKQKLKLRNLEPGDYSVQVRAKYKATSENETAAKSTSEANNKSSGLNSQWSDPKARKAVKDPTIVSDISGSPVYQCLLDSGLATVGGISGQNTPVNDNTLLADIYHLTCSESGLNDADVAGIGEFLPSLVYLSISKNPLITNISPIVTGLEFLETLNLNYNSGLDLKNVSNNLVGLDGLQTIHLSGLNLTMIPELPESINYINLSKNKIVDNSGGFWPADALKTVVINNNATAFDADWKVDGPFTLIDKFVANLIATNMKMETLQIRNSLLVEFDGFGTLTDLKNLDLKGDYIDNTVDFSAWSKGLCSLALRSDNIENISGYIPVQFLNLRKNAKLKTADLLTDPNFQPLITTLIQSNNLLCSEHNKISDSNATPILDMSSVPNAEISCPLTRIEPSLTHATKCKPDPVATVSAYKDDTIGSRTVLWEVGTGREIDYPRWGVTKHKVAFYQGDTLLSEVDQPLGQNWVVEQQPEATKVEVSACVNDDCGYEISSTNFIDGGLGIIEPQSEFWLEPALNEFKVRFTYADNYFTRALGRPDYFELTPIVAGIPSGQVENIDVDDNNESVWQSNYLLRSNYPTGDLQIQVRACRNDIACGPASLIAIESPSPSITTFEVYKDDDSTRRYLVWDANYLSSVTHYMIEARKGSLLLETFQVNAPETYLTTDYQGTAPTKYRVKACVGANCGQWSERDIFNSFIDGGPGTITPQEVAWQQPELLMFNVRFSYSNDYFTRPLGEPDYFVMTPMSGNNVSGSSITQQVGSTNFSVWESGELMRSDYPAGDLKFEVKACRNDISCGPASYISVVTPDSTLPEVSEFNVYEDHYSNRRYMTWAVDNVGATTHYIIDARNGNTLLDTYYVDATDTYLSADYLGETAPTKYYIRACVNELCGDEVIRAFNDGIGFHRGLTTVKDLKVLWDTSSPLDLKIKFEFAYPADEFNATGGRPTKFKLLSTFPQDDGGFEVISETISPSANHQAPWEIGFLNRADVVGSSFVVLACNDLIGCSKQASIAVGQPIIDETLPTPVWEDISYDQGTHTMTLNWSFPSEDGLDIVDYIQITETKPKVKDDQVISDDTNIEKHPTIQFYSHDILGPLKLNRLAKGGYSYEIAACQRGDDGVDSCSPTAAPLSTRSSNSLDDIYVDRTDVTAAQLDHFTDVGWVRPIVSDETGLPTNHSQLYWSYNGTVKPDYFILNMRSGAGVGRYCSNFREEFRYDENDQLIRDENGDPKPFPERDNVQAIQIMYADNVNQLQWSSIKFCEFLSGGTGTSSGTVDISACKHGVGCSTARSFNINETPPTTDLPPPVLTLANESTRNQGGAADFNPGLWWHPDLTGTGWSFFWANGLSQTNLHGLYGEAYDLVGYWLAYKMVDQVWTPTWFEARLKFVQEVNGEKLYQGDIFSHQRNTTTNAINSIDTGNISIKFNPESSSEAIMSLSLDYSQGMFSQPGIAENIKPYRRCTNDTEFPGCSELENNHLILEFKDFAVYDVNTTLPGEEHFHSLNDIDHFMGLWQHNVSNYDSPLSSAEVSIATWIVGGVELNNIMYFDAQGDPIWLQASAVCKNESYDIGACTRPVAEYFNDFEVPSDEDDNIFPTDGEYNVRTIPDGFNPIAQRPGEYEPEFAWVGETGRTFAGTDPDNDFRHAEFWLDIQENLQVGNRVISTNGNYGTGQGTMIPFEKRANLHGIEFNINEFDRTVTDCDLNVQPACNIYLTWYTDDNFGAEDGATPPVKPMFSHDGGAFMDLDELCEDVIPASADARYATSRFNCRFKEAYQNGGDFIFQYWKEKYDIPGSTAGYLPIAQSKTLTITGCSDPDDCGHLHPQPTEVEVDPTILPHEGELITHNPGESPLPGSGGVSGGTATYNLPLVIPPGINGMAPDLSVTYSSKAGNGIMGVGWSVSVGSSIYRCGQTQAQDGAFHAVNFTTEDRLCMDGQRLMAEPTNASYWINGTEYRTETDTFARITQVNLTEFKVQTKSGRTNTYQQLGTDQESSWQITRSEDSFGNNIIYDYDEFGENEFLLINVYYTGKNLQQGDRRIELVYQDRATDAEMTAGLTPRYNVSFNAGEKTEQTKLLSSINTYTNQSTLNRSYDFSYQVSKSNDDLLLSQVTETSAGIDRILLETNWSGDEWSNNTWLDKAANNYQYDSIINAANTEILGTRLQSLLGAAKIDNDYDGDGIKEYLAVSGDGRSRSLFFFDHNNVIKAQIKLPNDSSGPDQTRSLGAADLTFNGYTDLIDNHHVYSWKVNKKLPTTGQFTTYNHEDYFNQIAVPFSDLDDLYADVGNIPVIVDESKTQSYFVDYNHDGLMDLIQYITPIELSDQAISLCWPLNPASANGSCVREDAKIVLHINNTNPASCDADSCALSFAPAKVIVDGLRANYDLEGESDIWFYLWDEVTDVSDFNGDGIPDIHLTRWSKVAFDDEFDYQLKVSNDRIVFTTDENETLDADDDGIRLTDLGLSSFTCQVLGADGSVVNEPCDAAAQSVLYNKAYHFTDVNADGLKDFVYYDKGDQYLKSWKVRLNQGGDVPDDNSPFSLFGDTYQSDLNDPANDFSMTQPGECVRDNTGRYSSSTLARKCNPYFRAATYMNDLDSDGVPELIMPDHRIDDATPKPENMVYNYCSIFSVGNSTYPRTDNVGSGAKAKNTNKNSGFDVYHPRNIIPRYSASTGNTAGSEEKRQYDPLLQRSSFYPYTPESEPDFQPTIGFRDFIENYDDQIEPGINGLEPTRIAWVCAYNDNDYISLSDGTQVQDMYQDFDSASALADRSLYRYNAIKFDLSADNGLQLTLSDKTGIYRPLFQGSVGDLSGDGITDTMSTVGCIHGSDFCKSVVDVAINLDAIDAGTQWPSDTDNTTDNDFENQLKNFGTPIVGNNQAQMPNMLTSVTKPSTGQWVSWDYHPLTADISDVRTSDLALYRLPERDGDNCEVVNCDSYIDESGGKGSHIQFNSSMYVVSEMRQSNGLETTSGDLQYNTTQYGYEEAVYNIQGRGFQGFRKITVDNFPMVDSTLNQTRAVSTFTQVFPKAGKLDTVENFNRVDGELRLTSETDYEWYDHSFTGASNPQVVYHPPLYISSKSYDYEENGTRKLYSSQSQLFIGGTVCAEGNYDDFGNILCSIQNVYDHVSVEKKPVSTDGNKDDLKTLTKTITIHDYEADTSGNKWWVDKLKSTEVTTSITETGDFESPYSDSSTLNHQSKNLFFWQENEERKLDCQFTVGDGTNPTSCNSVVSSDAVSKNTFTYDDWGNVSEVKASGIASDQATGQAQQRTTETKYALSGGYFAREVTKNLAAVDYTSKLTYDPKTGQMLTSIDEAGIKTTQSYDAFGYPIGSHVTLVADATDQLQAPSTSAMQSCDSHDCSTQQTLVKNIITGIAAEIPANTGFYFGAQTLIPELKFVTQSVSPASPITTSWLDQNGQVVLTKTEHSGPDAYVLTLTNPLGQNELTTQPFQVSESNPYFTHNAYDERGRMSEQLIDVGALSGAADADNCKRQTTYQTHRGQTKVTAKYIGSGCEAGPNDLVMYRTYDAAGKLRQTVDAKNYITSYWYDSHDNPAYLVDNADNAINTVFDDLGRKTSVDDPNMGLKTFKYNSFGEVVYEQDAVQRSRVGSPANYTVYDQWGRVKNKYTNVVINAGVFAPAESGRSYQDTYDYSDTCRADGSISGHSLLCGSFRSSNYNPLTESHVDDFYEAHTKEYLYDDFNRVVSEVVTMPGVLGTYGSDQGLNDPRLESRYYYYENYNLPLQTIHDNIRGLGLSVVNHYDAYGSLVKQVENPSNQTLMEVTGWTLRGQPKLKRLNELDGVWSSYKYYEGTGQVSEIANRKVGSDQIFTYAYDAWGNIASQKLNGSITETFEYDKLQRLTESKVGNYDAITYGYDATGLGNLTSKSDYSMNQSYGTDSSAGPNAITSAVLESGGTMSYFYDANGNRHLDYFNDNNLQAEYVYDSYNLLIASERRDEGQFIDYHYGVDNLRYAKIEDTFIEDAMGPGGKTRKEITLYMGPKFEQVINTVTNEIETKFQLTDYLTISLNNVNIQSRHFTQRDRLGSTTQILDETGAKVHSKGYDAFGKPRNGDDWSKLDKPALQFESDGSVDITKRGFTDHEHLDAFELIHMNGRMYDFNNGRFLSVDPFIQGTTSQAINPYSYIQNNPLSGTDPTGYAIRELSEPYGCNTTFSGGCAQDGNIFSQAAAIRNHAANSNGRAPSGLGVRKSGTGDVSDTESQEHVNNCSGALQCYLIEKNPETGLFENKGTVDELGEFNFLNGILNDERSAGLVLGPVHLDKKIIEESIDSFVLVHNPTEGIVKDGLETFRDKFGHSKAAKQLSALLNETNAKGKTFNIVAHSQGSAILKSAVKHHMKNGGGQLSNLRVRLHGPAINVALGRKTFKKAGVRFFGRNGGIDINSGDAVPNIIGGNTLNPFRILKSLFLAPTLSGKIGNSPHTFPVGCNEQGCK